MNNFKQESVDFKNIKVFKGLNALRFFAALLVVMHHSETIRKKNEIQNFEWLGLFRNGGNAVAFFFVLSGFLITYLLLKEQSNNATISIKRFYMKRVLRIWPLYFLLIFIGTICLPFLLSTLGVNYEMPYTLGETWPYFLFFLPGLVTFYFGHHLLEPLWSIGVEEVFYLFWAPLFKQWKGNIVKVLFVIIFVKLLLRIVSTYLIGNDLLEYLVTIFNFEAMAIGGLGAYAVFFKGDWLVSQTIFKPYLQVAILSVLAVYLGLNGNIKSLFWDSLFNNSIITPPL